MTQRLKNKAAIVTGGTSGIGRCIVETFRREGADVIFTGRNEARGREVEEQTGAHFVVADALDPVQIKGVAERATERLGRVDVLVNNAGGPGARCRVEDITPEILGESLAVHLQAPWLLMAAVTPMMRAARSGSIINMCSIAGQRVGAGSIAYSVSKAALIHLTRCSAAELGKHGIRVNSISPGFISTPIHTAWVGDDPERIEAITGGIAKFYVFRQALTQTGQPLDVADTALFLASDDSTFMTGTDIPLDGGLMWGQSSALD